MKPSRRKTKALKTMACAHCKRANKTKMKQGEDYCDRAAIKNGHCLNFQPEKPKKEGKK